MPRRDPPGQFESLTVVECAKAHAPDDRFVDQPGDQPGRRPVARHQHQADPGGLTGHFCRSQPEGEVLDEVLAGVVEPVRIVDDHQLR